MVPPVGRLVPHNRVSSASRMCLSTSVLLLLFDEQYRRLRSSKQVNMVFNAHRNLIGREKGEGGKGNCGGEGRGRLLLHCHSNNNNKMTSAF